MLFLNQYIQLRVYRYLAPIGLSSSSLTSSIVASLVAVECREGNCDLVIDSCQELWPWLDLQYNKSSYAQHKLNISSFIKVRLTAGMLNYTACCIFILYKLLSKCVYCSCIITT